MQGHNTADAQESKEPNPVNSFQQTLSDLDKHPQALATKALAEKLGLIEEFNKALEEGLKEKDIMRGHERMQEFIFVLSNAYFNKWQEDHLVELLESIPNFREKTLATVESGNREEIADLFVNNLLPPALLAFYEELNQLGANYSEQTISQLIDSAVNNPIIRLPVLESVDAFLANCQVSAPDTQESKEPNPSGFFQPPPALEKHPRVRAIKALAEKVGLIEEFNKAFEEGLKEKDGESAYNRAVKFKVVLAEVFMNKWQKDHQAEVQKAIDNVIKPLLAAAKSGDKEEVLDLLVNNSVGLAIRAYYEELNQLGANFSEEDISRDIAVVKNEPGNIEQADRLIAKYQGQASSMAPRKG